MGICQYCQQEPIRASNVPHNRMVWFRSTITAKGHYAVFHCDGCGRRWNTEDVYLTKPIRIRLSFFPKRWTWCRFTSHFAGYVDHQKKAWYSVLRIGPLMVTFGKRSAQWRTCRYVQDEEEGQAG